MATEKTLLTRIGLKVDTLANWNNSSLILKKGEVAFATTAAAAGSNLTEPVIMMKIGDGEHTFSNLSYNFYAKASDVLEAAKDSAKLTAFVKAVIADSGIASSDTVIQLGKDIDAVEADITKLKGDVNTEGSIAKAIADAIAEVNVADTAVTGKYVSKVSQVGGKIVVERADLPVDTLTTGSANGTVAFNGADIAVKGLGSAAYADAKSFDAAGSASAVASDLADYKELNDAAVSAAAVKAQQGIDDAAAALAKANEKTTMAEVEGKNYATKTEAQGYADAKDTAIAEAKKAGTDAAAALTTYKEEVTNSLAGKVDKTAYATDKAALEKSIQDNADAITLLTEGVDQEKIDGVKDLINYVEEHQTDFAGVLEDVEAAELAIAANATAIEEEEKRADAAEKKIAGDLADVVSGKTAVAEATHAVNADNATNAADAAKLGGVAADLYATKTYADDVAATAQSAAQLYAKGQADDALAAAKTYAEEKAGAVDSKLAGYYTKSEADAEFMNSTETGSAIDAKITALNLAATYEPIGAETRAKAYADGLAGNYATKDQGAKADSALQSIEVGSGLKVTAKASNKQTVEIDTDIVFVFDCGGASEHGAQA